MVPVPGAHIVTVTTVIDNKYFAVAATFSPESPYFVFRSPESLVYCFLIENPKLIV